MWKFGWHVNLARLAGNQLSQIAYFTLSLCFFWITFINYYRHYQMTIETGCINRNWMQRMNETVYRWNAKMLTVRYGKIAIAMIFCKQNTISVNDRHVCFCFTFIKSNNIFYIFRRYGTLLFMTCCKHWFDWWMISV